MKVVTLEDAAEDIERGREFYDSREPGVGNHFAESILADIESLEIYAGIHGIHFGFYRMLAKRFPFGIYYEVENNTAFVYAILDMRRDPLWIREELGRRR
jgi:hypothetical protein